MIGTSAKGACDSLRVIRYVLLSVASPWNKFRDFKPTIYSPKSQFESVVYSYPLNKWNGVTPPTFADFIFSA